MTAVQALQMVEMNDHEYAKALRERGWTGAYLKNEVSETNTFVDDDGRVLGKVVYDNRTSRVKARTLTRMIS